MPSDSNSFLLGILVAAFTATADGEDDCLDEAAIWATGFPPPPPPPPRLANRNAFRLASIADALH